MENLKQISIFYMTLDIKKESAINKGKLKKTFAK
jgi:hypothetical protein